MSNYEKIVAELTRDPNRSDRAISLILGVSHKTVAKFRGTVGSCIYAISDGHGHVKIGWTTLNVYRRVAEIQMGNPFKLKLVGLILNAPKHGDRALHMRFKQWRMEGEWFHLKGAVAEFVKTMPTPPPAPTIELHERKDLRGRIGGGQRHRRRHRSTTGMSMFVSAP